MSIFLWGNNAESDNYMDKARKYRNTVLYFLQMCYGQNYIHKSLESTEERSLAVVRY